MNLPAETILLLLVLAVIAATTLIYHNRALQGSKLARRSLPAFAALRAALARSAETGRAVHISPGNGTVGPGVLGRATSAETIAGLLAAERLANEAAAKSASILVSSGDAVSHLALRGSLRQAYQQAGRTQDYDPSRVQLVAHQDPVAYATGVMSLYEREQLEASQLIGSFGQEFLLIGADGMQRHVYQVAGTTSPAALPVMFLSCQDTLIGEEIFAAEAYLSDAAPSQSRLMTHDLLRTTIILLILGGVVYSLAQPLLGLPLLPGA